MSNKIHGYNPKAHSPAVYIPCWLIQVSNDLLSPQAKLLYGRLAQWSNEKGIVHRSVQQLTQELGMKKRALERTLKELRDVKLIATYQKEAGGVNHFQFCKHPWMNDPINPNLVYKSDLPPVKNDGTPPSKMTAPPVKNGVPKIKEIKRNKIRGSDTVDNSTDADVNPGFSKKHPSVLLTRFPKDFSPDEDCRLLLSKHANRTNQAEGELLRKFEKVYKFKYQKKSSDWQRTFAEFLARERPVKVKAKVEVQKSVVKFWAPGNPDYDRLHAAS